MNDTAWFWQFVKAAAGRIAHGAEHEALNEVASAVDTLYKAIQLFTTNWEPIGTQEESEVPPDLEPKTEE